MGAHTPIYIMKIKINLKRETVRLSSRDRCPSLNSQSSAGEARLLRILQELVIITLTGANKCVLLRLDGVTKLYKWGRFHRN